MTTLYGIPNCDSVRRALMLATPSVIKRPVVEWAGGAVTVGFDEALWAGLLR